ncbi:MAG TPA: helix-turn-helix domain-containing protein [Ktedonobacteraceae bacterium]
MTETENEDAYLTVKETCEILGISRQALNGYVERGSIKKHKRKLGNRVFFKRSEINALLEIRPENEDKN